MAEIEMTRGGKIQLQVNARSAASLVAAVCCILAGFTIAMHAPGHISMDTSMQLYEAMIGKSISWNPPFMSALMRWLGGGEIATASLVFITCGLTYAGYGLTVLSIAPEGRKVGIWRVLIALLVVLNPIVAVYVGIVWKDVVFAAFLCGGVGFGFAAGRGTLMMRWIFATVAAVLLAAGMLARQQGVFMAPLLLGVPVFMLAAGSNKSAGWARWILLPLVFLGCAIGLRVATASTIEGNAGRSTSVGYRSIMIFDMMGIIANSPLASDRLAYPVAPAVQNSIREIYRPSRIDTLDLDPKVGEWFSSMSPAQMRSAWWSLSKQNPGAYLHHRADAYATLIGLRGLHDTLPVHIGVEGNVDMLKALEISERRGARDLLIYRVASEFFDWPIYRHVFWIAVAAVCGVALTASKLPAPQRRATWLVVLASGLLYLAYIPTMIAADFRYLFGAMPLLCIALLSLLMRPGDSANQRTRHDASVLDPDSMPSVQAEAGRS